MYRDDLVYEFNDDMWSLYHDGTINDSDDFTVQTHQWLPHLPTVMQILSHQWGGLDKFRSIPQLPYIFLLY